MRKNENLKNKSDVELVNYYSEKLDDNINTCRVRNVVFIALFILFFFFGHISFVKYIFAVLVPISLLLYMVWFFITYTQRKEIIDKLNNCSNDNSYVRCPVCYKYKIADKICENCGDKRHVSDDKIVEEANKLEANKRRNIWISVMLCFALFLLTIILPGLAPTKPASGSTGDYLSYAFDSILYSSAVIGFLMLFGIIVILTIFGVRSKNKQINLKINAMINSNIVKCDDCGEYFKKNDKKHGCDFAKSRGKVSYNNDDDDND